jgi:hypothetical protein
MTNGIPATSIIAWSAPSAVKPLVFDAPLRGLGA